MSDLDGFWVHPCTVETYLGQATDGSDSYAAAVTVTGWLEETSRVVRDSTGAEVVSTSSFYTPTGSAGLFKPGSRVTSPWGRASTVLSVSRLDSGPLGLPDHVLIALT